MTERPQALCPRLAPSRAGRLLGRAARTVAGAALVAGLALAGGGCGGLPPAVPRTGGLDARTLEGGWHVLASNFPMWLDGKKKDPVFIYRVKSAGPPVELDDTVAYIESGRRETIEGTDTQDRDMPSHFTWRGRGILAAFASDWVVSHVDPKGKWAILYFTRTLATPEGVDVIARSPTMTREERAEVQKALSADPFLKEKSAGLVWLADLAK